MNVPRVQLRPDFDTSRIIKGNWQLADDHSTSLGGSDDMYAHMSAHVDAGITSFDCGDIYYGVEERIGTFIERFRRERGSAAAEQISVHTKYIPAFLEEEGLRTLDRRKVEAVIDRSLQRLKIERLNLVQLHWWNYDIDGCVDVALVLEDLKKAGKIHHIGGTNFNVPELAKMVDAGADIIVNQVQYSMTDRRAQNGMEEYCLANNVKLVCYGSLAGGLFSKKWLGIPDPGSPNFENVSLDKYYRIICDFGGWNLYQEMLSAMDTIAQRHGVSIPNVASRFVLEQPATAAVIQGSRHARHIADNVRTTAFSLDQGDYELLAPIFARSSGPLGDTYDLDREENRDALENISTEYFDVENGSLVTRQREAVVLAEPYGHHLNPVS
ncbi:aldo/keto reductase [Pseudarthrobacter sp. lyk4-40-TYG-27]|uniref:aldo/keto reductase n=1 Tax=Pseudarthrobacter sp. lyk4-40-TYG-27 TaxID=3040305 RepID=UPI0025558DAF|nr:aldo/keto reductase [Pseudarthrobacter sp. lyk4-40-TYG-27]